MSWLIVTPARNEADNLVGLAQTLVDQDCSLIGLWVVVDDGSTDGTSTCLPESLPFPVHVLRREQGGGLANASEFAAFTFGADAGFAMCSDATRVMKLDADVRLAPGYLAALADTPASIGLVTGRIGGRGETSRRDFTRGPLKCYSREAYAIVRELPVALGWDVVDEVALRRSGLEVRVVDDAHATVARRTGSSEGLLRGRRRAGVVSRWTGYHPVYFALRLLRYAVKRPLLLGSVVMAWSWATSGPGPFASELRATHRGEQVARLQGLFRVRSLTGGAGRVRASAVPPPPSHSDANPADLAAVADAARRAEAKV